MEWERGKPEQLPPGQANRKERCRLYGYEKAEKAKAAL
jgi:hypothetical protein